MENRYLRNIRRAHFVFVILILIVFSSLCMQLNLNKDPKLRIAKADLKDLEIPIYGYAEHLQQYTRQDGLVRGISYRVKLPYPAPDVLEFYDEAMRKSGYNPFVEEHLKYADRTWQTFVDGTKKGQPYVAQLTANWTDTKHEVKTVLVLQYYWYVDHSKSRITLGENWDLNISFQIMPFFAVPRSGEPKPK